MPRGADATEIVRTRAFVCSSYSLTVFAAKSSTHTWVPSRATPSSSELVVFEPTLETVKLCAVPDPAGYEPLAVIEAVKVHVPTLLTFTKDPATVHTEVVLEVTDGVPELAVVNVGVKLKPGVDEAGMLLIEMREVVVTEADDVEYEPVPIPLVAAT